MTKMELITGYIRNPKFGIFRTKKMSDNDNNYSIFLQDLMLYKKLM